MIRLQKYKEAKNILKKCCGLFKLDFKAQKEYENFIGIYGNMEDHVQLRKMKNLEKQESEQHS